MIEVLVTVALAVNIGSIVYHWGMARQYFRLSEILLQLVVEAYAIRRTAPIWRLYSDKPVNPNVKDRHDR
jgi:hypothetical protein